MWRGIDFWVFKLILNLFLSTPFLCFYGLILEVSCLSEIWLGSSEGCVECGLDDASCTLIR